MYIHVYACIYPWALLVALEELFSFLGRPEDGFQENPGNPRSHFGSILANFLKIFHDIFRLRFLVDFLIDVGVILEEFWNVLWCIFLRCFVTFCEVAKIWKLAPCAGESSNIGPGGSQMILKCVKNGSQNQCKQLSFFYWFLDGFLGWFFRYFGSILV